MLMTQLYLYQISYQQNIFSNYSKNLDCAQDLKLTKLNLKECGSEKTETIRQNP